MNKTGQKRITILSLMALTIALSGIGQKAEAAAATPYTVTLQTNVQEVITLSCDAATVNLGNLTPGAPVTGTSVCTGTTNANGGYDLLVKRDDATATMDDNATNLVDIADKTAWTPGAPNAAAYSGTGLGFTVFASTATKNTTWWGTGTTVTDAANLYAGFPPAAANIMVHAAYNGSGTTTSIGYKLNVPTTQRSGAYSGTVTYSATSKA